MRRSVAFAAGVMCLLASRRGESQSRPPADDLARADALFERGKSDMTANRIEKACLSFAESYSLDPSEGTLLALGLCHEQEGKLVRAFAELRDAHARATKSGRDDRQRVARAALARVAPRIGRIVVRQQNALPHCTTIFVDDDVVPPANVDTELPVMPGDHRILCEGSAGRNTPKTVSVDAGALRVVEVAVDEPPPPPAPLAHAEPAQPASARKAVGWVLGGAGALALGAGALFGVRAFDQWATVKSRCDPRACTDPSMVDETSHARTSALVSDITVVAGLALVAVATYLELTSPRPKAAR
jgi:hypothetical protein